MEAFLKEDRKKGFDFSLKSPLMRFYLIKESKYRFFSMLAHVLIRQNSAFEFCVDSSPSPFGWVVDFHTQERVTQVVLVPISYSHTRFWLKLHELCVLDHSREETQGACAQTLLDNPAWRADCSNPNPSF